MFIEWNLKVRFMISEVNVFKREWIVIESVFIIKNINGISVFWVMFIMKKLELSRRG